MFVRRILALCAIGICGASLASSDTLKTDDLSASEDLIALASDYIPFSEGRQQVFASTADLIKSFLGEAPRAPELLAVISASRIHVKVTTPPVITPPVTTATRPVTTTPRPVTITPAPVPITASPVPPKPYFNRTMHLHVDLTVPASDYTEGYDVEYHAESNTARTTVEDSYTIYRGPTGDGKVQYLKIQLTSKFDSPERHCTESPALPASSADSNFPGLPDLKPFHFVGYKTEEGKKVEHWMHAVVGRPGEIGAASGESLNYTHSFFVYRDGEDAVPYKYTVTTDSSVLGPASDTHTHRYALLAPPTSPLIPDRDKLCDVVMEYISGKPRSRRAVKKLDKP